MAFKFLSQKTLGRLALMTTLLGMQSCWIMGVCVDEEACEKYGNAKDSSSGGSCGNSTLNGSWSNSASEFFTFDNEDDCSFTAYCAMQGTYSASSTDDEGTLTLNVTSTNTNDTDCPAVGTYACDFSISATPRLSLDCPTAYGDSPGSMER